MARQVKIVTDGGGYNDQGLAVTASAGSKISNLYRVPHAKIDGQVVFTNKVWGLGPSARRRLERWAKSCRDANLRTRILIVLKFADGIGSSTIADQLRVAPATAVRVGHRFLFQGEEGLLDGRRDNGVPKIDEDLLQALAELIEGQPTAHGIHRSTWTREALAIALTAKTKVRVSISTLAPGCCDDSVPAGGVLARS